MKPQLVDFKLAVSAVVDIAIRDAVAAGRSTDTVFRLLAAESLELAARIHVQHGGCDTSFLGMAQDLLVVVRTGAQEQ